MAEKPQVKRGEGENALPYGGATKVNDAMAEASPPPFPGALQPEPGDGSKPTPSTSLDSVLFAPTDRPDEPITAGAPFGPGRSTTRHGNETSAEYRRRVADSLIANPGVTESNKRWLSRVARGL